MANINARSPYLVRNYHADLASTTLKLWVYTGSQMTSHTSTPTYTLTSNAVNGETVIDIAPLVKDYIETNFDGTYSTEIVWVDYTTQEDRYFVKDVYKSTIYYGASTDANVGADTDDTTSYQTFYYASATNNYPIAGEFLYTDSQLRNLFAPSVQNTIAMNGANCDYASYFDVAANTGEILSAGASCGFDTDWVHTDGIEDVQDTGQDTTITLLQTESSVTQLTGYYGYGYFEDGANPNNYTGISNGVYNFIANSDELSQDGWGLGSNLTLSHTASGDSYRRDCMLTQSSGSGVSIYYNLDEALPVGQEVTVSCWVIYTNSSGNSTRSFQLGYANGGSGVSTTNISVDLASGWQFLSHTFIVPNTYVSTPRIRFNADSSGASGDIYRMWNCACYLGQPRQEQMSTYGQAGVMKTNKRNIKLSVNEIYKPENETFNLGITSDEGNVSDTDGTIKAYESGVEISSFNETIVNGTGQSNEVVNYIKIPSNSDIIELDYWGDTKDTVYVHNTYQIPVYSICEPKYTPYKLTFVNRYGILEDLWFFKNSKLSLETKEESYRANIVSGGSYSINDHQYKTLYKEGKESLTINSGFYPESHNEAFKQLLLSEKVWINYKGQTLPCKIKDSSMSFKTQIQDKLINYTMNIEFSFDKINNVR